MKVLELFSGTGSVGKVCKERKYEVVSLDLIMPADINHDIMTWDYKTYPPHSFDLITASPVCQWWSIARLSNLGRKMKGTDQLYTKELLQRDIDTKGKPMVDQVFEIIDYFKPKFWWIENPQTGRMKEYIKKDYYDVDYCRYSDWGYKKRTRFWTNIKGFNPLLCEKKCGQMVGNRHKYSVSKQCSYIEDGKKKMISSKKHRDKIKALGIKISYTGNFSKHDRYRIPSKLIGALLDCI